jgi:hypothetical protein
MGINGNINNIFGFLKQINGDKKPWSSFTDEDHKQFTVYMIHRYISMYEPYIEVANYAQLLPQNDKEKIYNFYCEMIPKSNIWLKYIKGSQEKVSENLLKHIANYYTISFREAEEYISILGKEGVKNILEKSGIEDKEIKKLLKEIK